MIHHELEGSPLSQNSASRVDVVAYEWYIILICKIDNKL